jgi:hypothetical protein
MVIEEKTSKLKKHQVHEIDEEDAVQESADKDLNYNDILQYSDRIVTDSQQET